MPDIATTLRLIHSLADAVDGDGSTLRTLVELLPVGVLISQDAQCKSLLLNTAAAGILGISFDRSDRLRRQASGFVRAASSSGRMKRR